jgi:hypothetical protein
MDKFSSFTILLEKFLDEKEARLQSLAANAPQQMPDQAASTTYDDIRETASIHQPRKHNASAVATAQQLITNSNTTHLATTALTSFLDSVSRTTSLNDMHAEARLQDPDDNTATSADTRYGQPHNREYMQNTAFLNRHRRQRKKN